MKYDFDKITDRKGTDCLKYDFAKERGRHEGILPLWVADMDFPTLPQVSERLRKIIEHGTMDKLLSSPQTDWMKQFSALSHRESRGEWKWEKL